MTKQIEKRRYFKCPVQALYMMREFGVKITQRDNYPKTPIVTYDLTEEEMIEDILVSHNPDYEFENRLYVAKESEEIFKLKKDDYYWCTDPYEGDGSVMMCDDPSYGQEYCAGTIMRNFKRFFMGEIEELTN